MLSIKKFISSSSTHSLRRFSSQIDFKDYNKYELSEKAFDFVLPPYQPIIIRLDGNSFKKLTKQLQLKRHDERFHESMKETSIGLYSHIIGFKFIYSFSDEINIVIHNRHPENQFLSNRIQKLISTISSITSLNFSINLSKKLNNNDVFSYFDCRAFVLPIEDVKGYFLKRQSRCYANFLSSLAADNGFNNVGVFSNESGFDGPKKNIYAREDFLEGQGVNLLEIPDHFKSGFLVYKNTLNQLDFKSPGNKEINILPRAGLTISVSKVENLLHNRRYSKRISPNSCVYLAAILEYMVLELLELSLNELKKSNRIKNKHINLSIQKDEELRTLCKDVIICGGGVLPFIHPILQLKKKDQKLNE
ncbi:hypothetical protein ACTA71_001180 [Dictyostelium dimigraforme]